MRTTNPLWYLAALLLALGSWMAATVVAAGAWDPVRDATMTPISQRADAGGKSLAVFTDVLQDDRGVTCLAKDRDKQTTDLPAASLDITVDQEGNQWYLINFLPDGDEVGDDIAVRCTPADKRTDNATYAYATVTGFQSRGNIAEGIAQIGTGAGVVLAAWVFWSRLQVRRSRRLEGARP